MIVVTGEVYLWANWSHSLKEKRSITKSIIEKAKHKFNVSIAEIDYLDNPQKIAIGFACVSNSAIHATKMAQTVLSFIEQSSDAVVDDSFIEILS